MQKKWYLITIDDPNALCDDSLPKVIELISKKLNLQYVILDFVEILPAIQEMTELEADLYDRLLEKNAMLTIDELLSSTYVVRQFIWGDFFLFRNQPQNWINPVGEPYPVVVTQTDTTIRAIDNGYIDIITPHKEIYELIKENNYTIQDFIEGSLEDFTYPY